MAGYQKRRADPGPRRQVPGRREDGHVQADLGDRDRRGGGHDRLGDPDPPAHTAGELLEPAPGLAGKVHGLGHEHLAGQHRLDRPADLRAAHPARDPQSADRWRAEQFAARLRAVPGLAVEVREDVAYVGGGSLPDVVRSLSSR